MMEEVKRNSLVFNNYLRDLRMMNVLSVVMGVKVMSGDDVVKEFGEYEVDLKKMEFASKASVEESAKAFEFEVFEICK